MLGKVRAPKFGEALWVQGDPFEIQSSQSYVILLDFWTFGCINCLNVLPDLKRLEEEFGNHLKIVSVHTPKFTKEEDVASLLKVIRALDIAHCVIQDKDQRLWDSYAVKAWPTWVLIDTQGYVVMHESGEKHFYTFQKKIATLVDPHSPTPRSQKSRTLVAVDAWNDYLAVASSCEVRVYRKGKKLFEGSGFQTIRSLKLSSDKLYVSDGEAGSVSCIDLVTLAEELVVKDLRSPWGLEIVEDRLYIALAGSHQLLQIALSNKQVLVLAGNRFEGLRDGCDETVMLAQPSSLVWDFDKLWFVDAESSALRYYQQGCVHTLIGEGLFTFGDDNEAKLLQHPQSIAVGKIDEGCGAGRIFIADTYNDKIKVYDPMDKSIITLIENIPMPLDIAKSGCKLFIVCLGQRQLRSFDIKTMQLELLELE